MVGVEGILTGYWRFFLMKQGVESTAKVDSVGDFRRDVRGLTGH